MHIFYTPVVSSGEVMRAADDRALYKMKSSEGEDQKPEYCSKLSSIKLSFFKKNIFFY